MSIMEVVKLDGSKGSLSQDLVGGLSASLKGDLILPFLLY